MYKTSSKCTVDCLTNFSHFENVSEVCLHLFLQVEDDYEAAVWKSDIQESPDGDFCKLINIFAKFELNRGLCVEQLKIPDSWCKEIR